MKKDIIITCAVTGSGDSTGISPLVPKTPEEIANACIEAGNAGAAIAHLHVRDPKTGAAARELAYYKEVADRIRDSDSNVIINMTCGMGGDFQPGEGRDYFTKPGPGTDCIGVEERLAHLEPCRPEIASLDCGSLNFGPWAYISTVGMLEDMAAAMEELNIKPELECFELGHVGAATSLVHKGIVKAPPFYQFALGIQWGAPADATTVMQMRDMLPEGANWAAFGISRHEMPMVAQSAVLGGHVRVGLEDNLYISKGVFATNGQLVERAKLIVESMGCNVLGPDEARKVLGLRGTQ